MIFSQGFIEDLKSRIDIVELIREDTELINEGSCYIGHCPHKDHNDTTPSFRVWKDKQTFACMGCHSGKKGIDGNEGSDCIAYIQWMHNISFPKAVIFLANKYNIPLPKSKYDKIYKNNKACAIAYMYGIKGKAYAFIKHRGVNKESIKKYMIGSNGVKIIFPLFDKMNNIIGFNNRWINVPLEAKDKYKNSSNNEIFQKGNYLYNQNNIDNNYEYVYITEGPFDVILSEQYGAKNVLATLGTAFTSGHINLLKKINKKVVLVMDGDSKGQKAIKKIIEMLCKENIHPNIIKLPLDKDLCDMSLIEKDNILYYLEHNQVSYGQYIINDMLNNYDRRLNDLKLEILPEIYDKIKEISDPLEYKLIKQQVIKRIGIL